MWLGTAADPTLYFNYYNGANESHGTTSNLQTVDYYSSDFDISDASTNLLSVSTANGVETAVNLSVAGNTTLGGGVGTDVTTIDDVLRVVPRATAPYSTSTPEGTVWMDSGSNTMKVYLGSTWNSAW